MQFLLDLVPPQIISSKSSSRRRRLPDNYDIPRVSKGPWRPDPKYADEEWNVASDKQDEINRGHPYDHAGSGTYGPVIVPFEWLHDNPMIYSYPTTNWLQRNFSTRMAYGGWAAWLTLCVGISSYSLWALLIVLGLAFGENEFIPGIHGPGMHMGISGVMGFQAGYLLAQFLLKWNWFSLGGLVVLGVYTQKWAKGAAVSHRAHFQSMAEGFVAGLALNRFGPRRNPVQTLAKHSGKFTAGIFAFTLAFSIFLKSKYPDPDGFEPPF